MIDQNQIYQMNKYITKQKLLGKEDLRFEQTKDEIIAYNNIENMNERVVTIPNFVTQIGTDAFKNNRELEKVEFIQGSRLRLIGDGAFCNCKLLREINIPENVEIIGKHAFYNCKGIYNVDLKNNKGKCI